MDIEKESRIQRAVKAVNERRMSYEEASHCYNVPKSTIHDRAKGKYKAAAAGAPRKLSQSVELIIVDLLKFMSEIGFGLKKGDVLIVVENYLRESKQTNLFKGGIPTKKWYNGFIKKYENEISIRKASGMQAVRAVATQPKIIDNWFEQLSEIYRKNNLNDKPMHVLNCDESGYQFDQGSVEIICRRGIKNPKKLAPTNEKQMTTVLTCCDAYGNYLPHQIIYKGKHPNWSCATCVIDYHPHMEFICDECQ